MGDIFFWAKHQNKLFCLGSPPPVTTSTENRSTTHTDPHTFFSFYLSFCPPCHQLCSFVLSHRPKHKVAQTTTHLTSPQQPPAGLCQDIFCVPGLHPLNRRLLPLPPSSSLYFSHTIHGQQHGDKTSKPGQQGPYTKHV